MTKVYIAWEITEWLAFETNSHTHMLPPFQTVVTKFVLEGLQKNMSLRYSRKCLLEGLQKDLSLRNS